MHGGGGGGGGTTDIHRLRALDRVEDFWTTLEALFEELMCCENFYTPTLMAQCTKCERRSPAQVRRGQCLGVLGWGVPKYGVLGEGFVPPPFGG